MEGNPLATNQARKGRETSLTAEQKARVDKLRERRRNRTSDERTVEAIVRAADDQEYEDTGSFKTSGDGSAMADLVALRRFIMSLRQERERAGLSLNDVAERARIDKAALSRLENGQQLNPTLNTLARYAGALGRRLTLGLSELVGTRADRTSGSRSDQGAAKLP
jgi:ribosome-binding protein aMBF1 (putative translation factor)